MKKTVLSLLLIIAILLGKTRWSSNHIIPDADFIGGGEMSARYELFINSDTAGNFQYTHLAPFDIGFSEWLTLSLAYADGVSLGFKTRILDEYNKYMPSIAIGSRNLFSNIGLARAGLYNEGPNNSGEIYLALSKSAELITTRFHLGISSYPNSETELFNYFFGVEKFFGKNFYATLEGWSYADRLNLAAFGTFRMLKENRLEVAVGVIDLERLFWGNNSDFSASLRPDNMNDPVKPGISITIAYDIPLGFGSKKAFRTLEDLYLEIEKTNTINSNRLDSMSVKMLNCQDKSSELQHQVDSLSQYINSQDTLPLQYDNLLALLIAYNNIYKQEIFNPIDAKKLNSQILAFDTIATNVLIEVIKQEDPSRELKIRAVSLIGDLKDNNAVPFLLEKLATTRDSRMKIEIINTLGKIGDKTVSYALNHLTTSSDDGVAISAKEVLSKWDRSPNRDSLKVKTNDDDNEFIIENKLDTNKENKND